MPLISTHQAIVLELYKSSVSRIFSKSILSRIMVVKSSLYKKTYIYLWHCVHC